MPRSEDDAPLLVPVHAGCGASEIPIAALSYLDEHKLFLVLHDKVDLAKSAAIVLGNRLQALPLQEF